MDAMAAATAAQNAATAARTAADAAKAAIANLATWQTVGDDGAYYSAKAAEEYAGKAETQAEAAMAASTSAQGAMDVASATRYLVVAEAARDNAMDHRDDAMTKRDDTMTASESELMIDGKDKSVGATMVNADDGTNSVTVNDKTTITGRLNTEGDNKDPMHSVEAVTGVPFDANDGDANPPVADVEYVQAVAASSPTIGRTLDTRDDKARLMLVTSYVGTKSVKVFTYAEDAPAANTEADGRTSAMAGRIQPDGADTEVTTDDTFADLKSEGTYYLATRPSTDTSFELDAMDEVADDAEATRVYSYVGDATTADTDPANDVTVYLVRHGERKVGDTTTYLYRRVDIDAIATESDTEGTPSATGVGVTATIPEVNDYKYIHFGVWAPLGDAEDDGSQEVSGLGIGFLQDYNGVGLTPIGGSNTDMPNSGMATYEGDWVAAVQEQDEDGNGGITLEHGAASVTADFGDAEIFATLTGLATLEGDIDGNTFDGTKATVMDDNDYNLNSDGKFTGYVAGGFYGESAAEAGGVFDFASEDNEEGAFRGAFGGDKK